MRQHLSHYSARQVPHIPGPDSLHLEAFYYLTDDRLYTVSQAAQPTTPLWVWIKASLLVGHKHLDPLLAQMPRQLRFPVVAVCKAVAFCLSYKKMSFFIMAAPAPMLIHSFCRNEARIIRPRALSFILPLFAAHPDSSRARPAGRRRRLTNPYLRATCRAAPAPSGTAPRRPACGLDRPQSSITYY